MVDPKIESWTGGIVSGANLDATTYGSGVSFPSTWDVGRLFFRTNELTLYVNDGTEGTPTWKAIGGNLALGNGELGDVTITGTSTVIADGALNQYANLTVDAGAILQIGADKSTKSSTNEIGNDVVIFCTGTLTVNGTINATGRGALNGVGTAGGASGPDGKHDGGSPFAAVPSTVFQRAATAQTPTTGGAGRMANNVPGVSGGGTGTAAGSSDGTNGLAAVAPIGTSFKIGEYSIFSLAVAKTDLFGAGGSGSQGSAGAGGTSRSTAAANVAIDAGGAGGASGNGGRGGGGLFIFAKTITLGGSGAINADGTAGIAGSQGGAGPNGNNSVTGNTRIASKGGVGGNGGAGGNGGFILLGAETFNGGIQRSSPNDYDTRVNSTQKQYTNITALGGSGGTAGAAGIGNTGVGSQNNAGTAGSAGSPGVQGYVLNLQL